LLDAGYTSPAAIARVYGRMSDHNSIDSKVRRAVSGAVALHVCLADVTRRELVGCGHALHLRAVGANIVKEFDFHLRPAR
jgi:hypothetical protein